jgi:hypothetical protein
MKVSPPDNKKIIMVLTQLKSERKKWVKLTTTEIIEATTMAI